MTSLTLEQLRQFRTLHQGLHPQAKYEDIAAMIKNIGGLQSQELPSAYLGIRARTNGLKQADAIQSREVDRSFVMTWAMRGTLHLVSSDDVRWILDLIGERFIRQTNSRYQQLGLDEATRDKGTDLMCEILRAQGAMNRARLAEELSKYDIPVEGQGIHHLVRYAALRGRICLGAEVDGDLTYVVLDDWLNDSNHEILDEQEALSKLATIYLQGYAPATIEDFASWSGLSNGQAKTGFDSIKNDCLEVDTPYDSAWILNSQWEKFKETFSTGHFRILPRYDTYLLGYTNRDFMVDEAFAKQVYPGGGLIRSCVIADGQAIASWNMKRRKNSTTITFEPFTTIDPKLMPALENEVQDLGNFLNENTILEIS